MITFPYNWRTMPDRCTSKLAVANTVLADCGDLKRDRERSVDKSRSMGRLKTQGSRGRTRMTASSPIARRTESAIPQGNGGPAPSCNVGAQCERAPE